MRLQYCEQGQQALYDLDELAEGNSGWCGPQEIVQSHLLVHSRANGLTLLVDFVENFVNRINPS